MKTFYKSMAPTYANIFLAMLERKLLKQAAQCLIPIEWIRFIDDIFAIWTHGLDKLKTFLTYINDLHPQLNSITHIQQNQLTFLTQLSISTLQANYNLTYTLNPQREPYFYIRTLFTLSHAKMQSYTAKHYDTDAPSLTT